MTARTPLDIRVAFDFFFLRQSSCTVPWSRLVSVHSVNFRFLIALSLFVLPCSLASLSSPQCLGSG